MTLMGGRRAAAGGGGGGGWWVRWCLVTFAVISALCVSGPALFWKWKSHHSHSHNNTSYSSSFYLNFLSLSSSTSAAAAAAAACPSCNCQCPPPPSLLHFAPGLANLSLSDCGNGDPDVKKEMEKQFVDLLTEELNLQQGVASERALHMNATLSEARRLASLYQREADKCIAATQTCEGARERSELLLRRETKLTLLWEKRARKLGWQPDQ